METVIRRLRHEKKKQDQNPAYCDCSSSWAIADDVHAVGIGFGVRNPI